MRKPFKQDEPDTDTDTKQEEVDAKEKDAKKLAASDIMDAIGVIKHSQKQEDKN